MCVSVRFGAYVGMCVNDLIIDEIKLKGRGEEVDLGAGT